MTYVPYKIDTKTSSPATTISTPASPVTPKKQEEPFSLSNAIKGGIKNVQSVVTDVWDEIKNHDAYALTADVQASSFGVLKPFVQTIQTVVNPISKVTTGKNLIPDVASKMDEVIAKGTPTQQKLYATGDFIGWGMEIALTEGLMAPEAVTAAGVTTKAGTLAKFVPEFARFGKYAPVVQDAYKSAIAFSLVGQGTFKEGEGTTRKQQAVTDVATALAFFGITKVIGKGVEMTGKNFLPTDVLALKEITDQIRNKEEVSYKEFFDKYTKADKQIKEASGGKGIKEITNEQIGSEIKPPEPTRSKPTIVSQLTPENIKREIDELVKQGYTREQATQYTKQWAEKIKAEEDRVLEQEIKKWESEQPTQEPTKPMQPVGGDAQVSPETSPKQPVEAPIEQKSVEKVGTEGKTPSKASQDMADELKQQGILDQEAKVAGYNPKPGAAKIVNEAWKTDKKTFEDIALGDKEAPKGTYAQSFFSFFDNQPEGRQYILDNPEFARKLIESPVPGRFSSEAGGQIQALNTYESDTSPLSKIIKINKKLEESNAKENVLRKKEMDKIQKETNPSKVKQLTLDFINKIECK